MNIMYYVVDENIQVYDPRSSISHQWVPIKPNSILLKCLCKKDGNKYSLLNYHSQAIQIVVDGYVTDCNHRVIPILLSSLTDEGPDGRKWLSIKPKFSSLTEYNFDSGNKQFDIAIAGELF